MADLDRTSPVAGKSGCVTWLLPDGRPWLLVVADVLGERPRTRLAGDPRVLAVNDRGRRQS